MTKAVILVCFGASLCVRLATAERNNESPFGWKPDDASCQQSSCTQIQNFDLSVWLYDSHKVVTLAIAAVEGDTRKVLLQFKSRGKKSFSSSLQSREKSDTI